LNNLFEGRASSLELFASLSDAFRVFLPSQPQKVLLANATVENICYLTICFIIESDIDLVLQNLPFVV